MSLPWGVGTAIACPRWSAAIASGLCLSCMRNPCCVCGGSCSNRISPAPPPPARISCTICLKPASDTSPLSSSSAAASTFPRHSCSAVRTCACSNPISSRCASPGCGAPSGAAAAAAAGASAGTSAAASGGTCAGGGTAGRGATGSGATGGGGFTTGSGRTAGASGTSGGGAAARVGLLKMLIGDCSLNSTVERSVGSARIFALCRSLIKLEGIPSRSAMLRRRSATVEPAGNSSVDNSFFARDPPFR